MDVKFGFPAILRITQFLATYRPIRNDRVAPIVDAHEGDRTTVDESTDSYDTIDWLVKNVPNHNGNVGMWGISYGAVAALQIAAAAPPRPRPPAAVKSTEIHLSGVVSSALGTPPLRRAFSVARSTEKSRV